MQVVKINQVIEIIFCMTVAKQIELGSRWWSRNPFGFHDKIAQWATVAELYTTEWAKRTPLYREKESARLALAKVIKSVTSPIFSKGEFVNSSVARVIRGA